MDPRDFQRLAAQLAQSKSPARVRTSVSRSYYSVFNVSKEHFEKLQFPVENSPKAHKEIVHRFKKCGIGALKKIGVQLNDLRSMRNRADYDLQRRDAENRNTATAWSKKALNMIEALDRFFGGPEGEKIVKAIRASMSTKKP